MIHVADVEPRQTTRHRWRFRFGLKSLFVVMTILCVWLGYKVARERCAAQMIARQNALQQVIIRNITTPPPNIVYRIDPGSESELRKELDWPGEQFRRNTVLETGSTASLSSRQLVLDISSALANAERTDIAQQLVNHYSQGLEKRGLTRRQSGGGSSNLGGAQSTAIWTTRANEFTVIIEAEVAAEIATAEVRIIVIDAQQLRVW